MQWPYISIWPEFPYLRVAAACLLASQLACLQVSSRLSAKKEGRKKKKKNTLMRVQFP
jgi:hypothetical protein